VGKKVVSLEELEADRTMRECGSEYSRWCSESSAKGLMTPPRLARVMGKRPVGGTFNQDLLARSPGTSQHTGLDFVKAVYAEKTGQEHM
jgi:hypothetical protein